MRSSYFTDRNCFLLYLASALDACTDGFTWFFAGAFLFLNGLPLHFVLLFYGLEFGLRGIFSPLAVIFSAKYGLQKTMLLGQSALVVFFITLGFAHSALPIAFGGLVFHSLARGIYYPTIGGVHAVVLDNTHRGKQHSFIFTLAMLAELCGVMVSTWALNANAYPILAFFMSIVALGVAVPFMFLKDLPPILSISYGELYSYLTSTEYRHELFPAFGFQLAIIASLIILPFYMYFRLGDIKVYGFIIGLAIIVQVLFLLIFGRAIDRIPTRRSRHFASIWQICGNAGVLFMSGPLTAFLIAAYNAVGFRMFMSSINTVLDRKALRSKQPFRFMAAYEMALCFPELLSLSSFALFAFFWGELVFPVIFLSGILGLYITARYLSDEV